MARASAVHSQEEEMLAKRIQTLGHHHHHHYQSFNNSWSHWRERSLSNTRHSAASRTRRCSSRVQAWLSFGYGCVWEDPLLGTLPKLFLAHQWKHLEAWPKACPGPSCSRQGGHGGPSGASVASPLPRCYCENTNHTWCRRWQENKRTYGESGTTKVSWDGFFLPFLFVECWSVQQYTHISYVVLH